MIDILTRPLELHETHRDGNARREQQLRDVFARMTSAESLALHRRLGNPAASDELANAFTRLVADRRIRLLAYLYDPKRRAALRR